jgi:pilus assembly protein Flp/PilA
MDAPWVECHHRPFGEWHLVCADQNLRFSRPGNLATWEHAMKTIRRFLSDEIAATAIEYGLIAAGISLAIIAVVNGLGGKLNTKFTSINNSLK